MAETLAAVTACQYAAWYPRYEKWTLKSIIVPITRAFVAFLEEDGIILSDDTSAVSTSVLASPATPSNA
jgi:hypothetical protein